MSLTLTLERGGGGEVSGSGTNIELDGTIAGGAIESVEMYGDTEQAASPAPDSPQAVQTVTGRQVVTISDGGSHSQEYEINLGKNLLDEATMESGSFNYLSGGLFANATFIRSQQIPCEPNTTYAFSSNSNLGEFAVVYYASDKTTVVPGEGYLVNHRSTTFTTPATARYIRVKVGGSANPRTTDGDWDLQLEKGSTATTYAPYFTPIELCKIGDYQDYIYKSGDDWYVHKEVEKIASYGSESITTEYVSTTGQLTAGATVYYGLTTATDTQITNAALITQLNALNSAQTYDGTTVITVSSENLAGSLEVTVSTNIAMTYTEVEIGSPFTIADVEGKSQNTTLDGNIYVDFVYNKKQFSVDIFNLTPSDYATIRGFYDAQFTTGQFPTISIPELDISNMVVFFEMSNRNIVNQCLLTDKLTLKFRETVQP